MTIALYMDAHVPSGVTNGLRLVSVDVLTAQEDGTDQLPDPDLLDRAAALGRVIFTQDRDFLREAANRQQSGTPFAGVIYCHQMRLTAGQMVRDLEIIAKVYDPVDMANRVVYLPL